jgi:sialidase-1
MKTQKFIQWFYFCCILLSAQVSDAQTKSSSNFKSSLPGGIRISYISPLIPTIKKFDLNPLLRVRVYVPAGKPLHLKSLSLTFDKNAIDVIEELKVYNTLNEPTIAKSSVLLATVNKLSNQMNIPFDLEAKPGITYILIIVKLKEDADIDKKYIAKATHLTTATGEKLRTPELENSLETKTSSIHRLGIAVRSAWDDSVHTYRIPGLATTDKGTLIAVYDARFDNTRDLPGNIDVGMSRSTDGGKTWEPMKIIMDMGAPHENNGIGDPAVLFDPGTKKVWVAALWSKGNRSIAGSEPGLSPDTTGQFVLVSSDDDGLTWSAPYNITSQVKNPIWHLYFNGPGAGVTMENGTLVFASQYWDESKKPGIPHSSIIFSEDHGKTWKSGIGAKSNTTESQVVETTPGTLMLNMRDNRGRFRSIATTKDMGKSWVEHHTSYEALPDPVSMASLIKARVNVKGKMKDVLFFSNVNSTSARFNTTIKASLDLGESWLPENEVSLDLRSTYGYSALTKIDDNTIGILYEGARDLYFIRVPVSDIIK